MKYQDRTKEPYLSHDRNIASKKITGLSYANNVDNPGQWSTTGDHPPYTAEEWRNAHLRKLAQINVQPNDLAWKMAQDFDCYETIFWQFVAARPLGETHKNPFYVYGRTKRFKIYKHERSFEVQQSADHNDDFDADFIKFARQWNVTLMNEQ